MENKEVGREWFSFAAMDYESARFLLNMSPLPLEIIYFHCEQAAEKMLKGYLVYYDIDVPKTYDLVRLCELCSEIEPEFERISEYCFDLRPYGVQVRYPAHIDLLESDMHTALNAADQIMQSIRAKVDLV